MTPDQILVTVSGLAAIAQVARFFWFKKTASVRAAAVTDGYQEFPVELMPGDPGEHEFACQKGMLRGRIMVEAA